MKQIEWSAEAEGTLKVDDNAAASEIEALVKKEIAKNIVYEWKEQKPSCGSSKYNADFTNFTFVCDEVTM